MGEYRFERAQRRSKKKVIEEATPKPEDRFRSIFSPAFQTQEKAPTFLPPEYFSEAMSSVGMDDLDDPADLASASAWDVATRYHEFKAKPSMKKLVRELRRLSAGAILERAREVLGSVVHPTEPKMASWSSLPPEAEQVEIDIEETLESSPLGEEIWMSYREPRHQAVVITVDTSLSMTGEKLALTAVALAVVLLQFPNDPVGIVAFENEAMILKRPLEKITLQELLERFLDVPAQGYTHLEEGLKCSLKLIESARTPGAARLPSAVLLTDGKYTAGRDPAYLAPKFPHLVVLKMGKERASLDLCRELAKKGNGTLKEVPDLETLPLVMYGVVKDLLRGRSL